ncbi:MAG TPA: hypothetical protein VKY90_21795 [Candidatus Dormibacteraeota bacterium]|nr:hypothetical protein [Candidatus Dormibacteraeota bacterium]
MATTLDDLERWGEASPPSPLARKSRWRVAEAVGDAAQGRRQRRLDRVSWDVDAAPDRLQAFVHEPFGDPEGIGVLDGTGFLGAPSERVPMGPPDRRHAAWARVPGPVPGAARGLVTRRAGRPGAGAGHRQAGARLGAGWQP